MSKVMLQLDVREAKSLIEQMPIEDRIRLFREFMKDRVNVILKNIDTRRKRHKISDKEISKEIEKARQEFYARYH